MTDIVVLVPDLDTEQVMRGLLPRHEALRIRPFTFKVLRHPHRDPGCLREAVGVLREIKASYAHALVIFDHEGCGQESQSASDLEDQLRDQLSTSGWGDRADALILVPELEIWVWSDSPKVDDALGWSGRVPKLRDWLINERWLIPDANKPGRPKEAMKAAMNEVGKGPSAPVFNQLARTVSINRCRDEKFGRLITLLRKWFPPA